VKVGLASGDGTHQIGRLTKAPRKIKFELHGHLPKGESKSSGQV
jgi:hypothetical protein